VHKAYEELPIPQDIWLFIYTFLAIQDILRLECVCQYFYILTFENNIFWKDVYMRKYYINVDEKLLYVSESLNEENKISVDTGEEKEVEKCYLPKNVSYKSIFKAINDMTFNGKWYVCSSYTPVTVETVKTLEFICSMKTRARENINNNGSFSLIQGEGITTFSPFYFFGCGVGLVYSIFKIHAKINASTTTIGFVSPTEKTLFGKYVAGRINDTVAFGYTNMSSEQFLNNFKDHSSFNMPQHTSKYFINYFLGTWNFLLKEDENTLTYKVKIKSYLDSGGLEAEMIVNEKPKTVYAILYYKYCAIAITDQICALLWNDDNNKPQQELIPNKRMVGVYCKRVNNVLTGGYLNAVKE